MRFTVDPWHSSMPLSSFLINPLFLAGPLPFCLVNKICWVRLWLTRVPCVQVFWWVSLHLDVEAAQLTCASPIFPWGYRHCSQPQPQPQPHSKLNLSHNFDRPQPDLNTYLDPTPTRISTHPNLNTDPDPDWWVNGTPTLTLYGCNHNPNVDVWSWNCVGIYLPRRMAGNMVGKLGAHLECAQNVTGLLSENTFVKSATFECNVPKEENCGNI